MDPQNEANVVHLLENFGWQLIDSREYYNESTEIVGVEAKSYNAFMRGFTGKDGKIDVQQRRTVTNYITLQFARDTSMENYARLKELNEEFENNLRFDEPKKPIKRTGVLAIGLAILVISIIMAIVQGNKAELWEILVSIGFAAVMIPLTVVGWLTYKKKIAAYDAVQARMYDIIHEAEQLL